MRPAVFLFLVLLPGLVGLRGAVAATIKVPFDKLTIMDALGIATSGDVIEVALDHTENGTQPLRMKADVTLKLDPSTGTGVPTIAITADTAVVFSSHASAGGGSTVIAGFNIVGFQKVGVFCTAAAGGTFTLQNNTIEGGNGSGVFVLGASSTVQILENVIDNCGTGIMASASTGVFVQIRNNHLTGNGDAISVEGSAAIERNTIIGNNSGIVATGIGGFPFVRENLVTGNGFGVNCFPVLERNNVWNNTVNFDCAGTPSGNLSQDPLFCSGDITVHINSVCAPANNAWNVRIGARWIGCAYGILAANTILSMTTVEAGDILLTSDLKVPAGKSLRVDNGVTIRSDLADEANLGNDTARNELIVQGSLLIAGFSGPTPARFTSTTGAEGDWYGIDATNATSMSVRYADISSAVYGLRTKSSGTSLVEFCTFSGNQNRDILAGSSGSSLPVTIQNNMITVGSATGIEFQGTVTGADLVDNTIVGDATSMAGILMGTATGSSSPNIRGNTIRLFPAGSGIQIPVGSPILTTNTIIDSCKYGILVTGGTPQIGTDSSSDNEIHGGNTHGIFVSGSSAAPKIRNNRINGNQYGVTKKSSGSPDLGTTTDDGLNDLSGDADHPDRQPDVDRDPGGRELLRNLQWQRRSADLLERPDSQYRKPLSAASQCPCGCGNRYRRLRSASVVPTPIPSCRQAGFGSGTILRRGMSASLSTTCPDGRSAISELSIWEPATMTSSGTAAMIGDWRSPTAYSLFARRSMVRPPKR